MNKTLLAILVVIIVVVGGYFLMSGNGNEDQFEGLDSGSMDTSNVPPLVGGEEGQGEGSMMDDGEGMMEEEVKEFSVTGSNFEFSVTEIRVKKGDTVKIVFNVTEDLHDWVIDEFNAKTARLEAGGSEVIEFVADQAGEFEYYCSVGTHRQIGMVGKLIVEE